MEKRKYDMGYTMYRLQSRCRDRTTVQEAVLEDLHEVSLGGSLCHQPCV